MNDRTTITVSRRTKQLIDLIKALLMVRYSAKSNPKPVKIKDDFVIRTIAEFYLNRMPERELLSNLILKEREKL